MNRRTFLQTSTSALLLASAHGIKAEEVKETKGDSLKVRFLGTGAADWNGKDERGELRRLSSILVDDRILIDLTASDVDMIPEGLHPETIFYTHSHGDHYNPQVALDNGIKRVFLSETWVDRARHEFAKVSTKTGKELPEINPLAIGCRIHISDIAITPLPANHATSYLQEQALIYLIEKGNVRLIYATDTGGLPAVATRLAGIDSHQDGKPITALIMEATMGMGLEDDFRTFTHSSVDTVIRTVNVLTRTKRYLPAAGQSVYITHLARTLHGTQRELDSMLPLPIRAAHDGLEVIFR